MRLLTFTVELLLLSTTVEHVLTKFTSIRWLVLLVDDVGHSFFVHEIVWVCVISVGRDSRTKLVVDLSVQEICQEVVLVTHLNELLNAALPIVEDAIEAR